MNRIRLAIIGLGRFAALHAPILAQMEQVEVTAICDINPDAFAPFQQWFPKAELFTDWQEMLSQRSFDAVDILTPEPDHAAPALAALASGAHVFVEKPMATSADEALQMMQAAEKHGRVLMIGHVLRFDPRYREIKKRLAQKQLGTIRSIYAKRANSRAYFSIYSRIDPVFILGIHDIDLMHWYFEEEVREVHARGSTDAGGRVDLSWAQLTFAGGGIGILENHWLLPEGAPNFMDVRMEITGEAGKLVVQEPEQAIVQVNQEKQEMPVFFAGYEDWNGRIRGALTEELEHFAACAATSRPSSLLRPHDAYRAVLVAEAVKQSMETGRVVQL